MCEQMNLYKTLRVILRRYKEKRSFLLIQKSTLYKFIHKI